MDEHGYREMRDALVKTTDVSGLSTWHQRPNGSWDITVSQDPDWRVSFCQALRAFVEMGLCVQKGISEDTIAAFVARVPHETQSWAGDIPAAPHYHEHQFANRLMRFAAAELGVKLP